MRLTLTVRIAWWVKWYIATVQTFTHLTGMEPDVDKVVAVCMRGVSIK